MESWAGNDRTANAGGSHPNLEAELNNARWSGNYHLRDTVSRGLDSGITNEKATQEDIADSRNPALTFRSNRPLDSAQSGQNGSIAGLASTTWFADSADQYQVIGNTVLKADNVMEFRPKPRLVEAKPKGKPKGKAKAFRENEGSLPKSWFPLKIKGATGWFDPVANGQGWIIRFRDTKPLAATSDEKSFQFPRISQETYLTLKGMKSDAERKRYIQDYVRGNLIRAIRQGNDRARAVASRLNVAS